MYSSKLFGTRTYLIGAMDRVKDGGTTWRNMITPVLHKLGVIVFDPCKKPTFGKGIEDDKIRAEINDLKRAGKYDEVDQLVRPTRVIDLRMVDISDFIVCNIDMSVHACGTYEELFLANREKKPIIVHCEQGKSACSNWLFGTIPHEHIFGNWSDLVLYLNDIAYGIDTRLFNRWTFFDLQKITNEMLAVYNEN